MQISSLETDGLKMTYLEAGSTAAQPVLLIHGLGWDAARLWSGTAKALVPAGFRVLAPNLRGVGGTDASDLPYSTELYADDIDGFLGTLSIERLPVVGFSMGAAISAALASRSGRVAALCFACGGLHSSEAARQGVEEMLARATSLGAHAFAAEQATAIFHTDWAAAHPNEVADFKTWRAEMDQSALFRAFRSGYGIDYRQAVREAGLPTHVIAADTDPFCALEDLKGLAASIPGAGLDVIANSGHMAMIEQPSAFNTALLHVLQNWTQTA